jgi:hypothetical protein
LGCEVVDLLVVVVSRRRESWVWQLIRPGEDATVKGPIM